MYIATTELNALLYDYQLTAIVGNDTTLQESAILSAETEVKSYLLAANNLRHTARLTAQQYAAWQEYDVETIFAQTGANRNALLIRLVQEIATYNICTLCNVDMLYDKLKDLHSHAVDTLERIAGMKGVDQRLILTGVATTDDNRDGDNDPATNPASQAFYYTSRRKFQHE